MLTHFFCYATDRCVCVVKLICKYLLLPLFHTCVHSMEIGISLPFDSKRQTHFQCSYIYCLRKHCFDLCFFNAQWIPINARPRKAMHATCSYRCLLGCLCLYVFMCAQKHDIRSWLVSIRFAAWNVSVEASLPHSQQSVDWIDQRLWNAFVRHHTQSGDHLIIVFQIDFDAMPHISFIHSIHRNAFSRSFK